MGAGAIVAGVGLAASAAATAYSSSQSAGAAKDAANAQAASAQAGIDATTAANNKVQQILSPYSNAGADSIAKQQDLLGLNGNDKQLAAINAIKTSSQYGELNKQGQDSILQNASATGGLRGGNTQAALAQFSPALLNSLINDQYTKLGGITSIGENAGAQTGNMGMQSANSVSALLAQQGRANAGGILGQANATNNMINTGANLLGNATRNISGWGGLSSGDSLPSGGTGIDYNNTGMNSGTAFDSYQTLGLN